MKSESPFKGTMKTIAGVCIILISILTILYGGNLYSVGLRNVDFMSFLVGGMIGITIGVCMISRVERIVKQGVILLTGVILSGYCFLLDMDLFLASISAICVMGIAVALIFWLSVKGRTSNTVKICKKCSAVSAKQLEKFAAAHEYRVKYGCIGKCRGHSQQPKEYVGLCNGKMIQADSEADFFEKLNRQ